MSDLEAIQMITWFTYFLIQKRKRRSRKGKRDAMLLWVVSGRDKPRFQVPCPFGMSFYYSPSFATTGETIVLCWKPRSEQLCFRMLPAGLLISRVKKKKKTRKNERCWTNLLQVRLSVSCYATRPGGFTICGSWVGSNWIWLEIEVWVNNTSGVGGNNHSQVCLWCLYL